MVSPRDGSSGSGSSVGVAVGAAVALSVGIAAPGLQQLAARTSRVVMMTVLSVIRTPPSLVGPAAVVRARSLSLISCLRCPDDRYNLNYTPQQHCRKRSGPRPARSAGLRARLTAGRCLAVELESNFANPGPGGRSPLVLQLARCPFDESLDFPNVQANGASGPVPSWPWDDEPCLFLGVDGDYVAVLVEEL